MEQVIEGAVADAQTLAKGGVDAIMVENYGDTPFFPAAVPAVTISAITRAVVEVRRVISIPVGVNVLRNDAASALGVCAATGAAFIRVNVHTGSMLTDQGWIDGAAHETMRSRAQLDVNVAVFADVFVKHATPPQGLTIEDAARDTWERGQADALVVSGSGTGLPTSIADIRRVKDAVHDAPVFIGSGLTHENAFPLLGVADGAIVGTALKGAGSPTAPVSLEQVGRLMDIVARIRT